MALTTAYSSQVTPTQLEQVRPKLAKYLVMLESKFAKKFVQQTEKHRVSALTLGSGAVLGWRIPVLTTPGGDYQAFALDGGDLGNGSLMNVNYMTVGYFATNTAFLVPALAAYATKTNQQAMTNVLQQSLMNALTETALYNEIGLFQDGTGLLATANGTGSPTFPNPTYNLETAAFSFIRLRGFNALVDVYGSNNVLKSTGLRVSNISFTNNTVTLSGGTSYTPANTDIIAFPGMGTPVGTFTATAGTWRNGIYTFNTLNTSGSLLGLSYASTYELATNQVNANGGFMTPSLLLAGKTQLIQRRDDSAWDGLIGVCHMAQRTSWYIQGITISNWFRGKNDSMIDVVPSGSAYGDTFQAGDVDHFVSRYANKSRVEWINPKNFGWVQLDDINFYQTPDGQRIFNSRSSTTGNPQAAFQFYMVNTRNLYSVDPGCGVVFYNMAIPAGN